MVAGVALTLVSPDFTLSWTHSIEHVEWRESWRVEAADLRLVRVAVKGSGAGMEPGDGARLEGGFWVWSPDMAVPALHLAASGATGGGWTLCAGAACRELGAVAGGPVDIAPCGR